VYNFGEDRSVVLVENILIEITLRVQRISSNIFGCTRPIFATFSPYESAIHADDGSVPYFPICLGTLPWQQNSFAAMKQTDTTSILCRLLDGSSVSFRYYLLGVDIVAPSWLLARLCHAFLVSSVFDGRVGDQ